MYLDCRFEGKWASLLILTLVSPAAHIGNRNVFPKVANCATFREVATIFCYVEIFIYLVPVDRLKTTTIYTTQSAIAAKSPFAFPVSLSFPAQLQPAELALLRSR